MTRSLPHKEPKGVKSFAIGIEDVRAAQRVIAGRVLRTPCLPAPRLSALSGAEIVIKYETMQVTSSFKERGACARLAALTPEERKRGVIAMSAGNHAQAVAYHAAKEGIPATIVMPVQTPLVKIENTRSHGATVVLIGEHLSESQAEAERIAARNGLVFVHPYDDPLVMAGQGTIALEMMEEYPDLDMLVIPIGGGGLFAGNAVVAKALKPDIEIIGVEAGLYPSCRNAIKGEDRPVGGPTLAEGIAVKNIGKLTLPIIAATASDILTVDELAIEDAINALAIHQRVLAEGAGAAGLAAILSHREHFAGRKVGLILCGGNIDARLLASIMVRALERADRIVSIRITTNDRPGVLGAVASRLGALGANILEVSHGRLFLDVPAKGVSLDLTIETRDADHTRQILDALAADGFTPIRLDPRGANEGAP